MGGERPILSQFAIVWFSRRDTHLTGPNSILVNTNRESMYDVVAYRSQSLNHPLQLPSHPVASPTGAMTSSVDESHLVQTFSLSKRYGDFEALSGCTLGVRRGEIFGLLGPNGAGKTTLIRLLLGFLRPTSGRCEINGFDPLVDGVGLRRCVAYLPGDARLPRHMRGASVLRFFAEMHPGGDLERSRQIADRLELETRRHVAFMSTGMRQKLALVGGAGARHALGDPG